MIEIKDKHFCCGCSACASSCPTGCISLKEDKDGFRYPAVEESSCISCGKCESVCPVLSGTGINRQYTGDVYAMAHPDTGVRYDSSSGGAFSMLAEETIGKGGLVFGAAFNDEWDVVHVCASNKTELASLRGSKYVQSEMGNCFLSVKEAVCSGRQVLFSGTPCMIAGLRKYLRKDYDNLLLVDIVCHGVPSPKVWKTYLRSFGRITKISFRDKSRGWKMFSMVVDGEKKCVNEPFEKNPFMTLFLKNLCLRPSCYRCQFKAGKSGSDITIGDFWGIQNIRPDIDDDSGLSLVIPNTVAGKTALAGLDTEMTPIPYEEAIRRNRPFEISVPETADVAKFWQMFHSSDEPDLARLAKRFQPSLLRRAVSKLYREMRSMLTRIS